MNELMSGNKTYETVIPNINNITHGADFRPAVKHANGNKALLKPRCFDFFALQLFCTSDSALILDVRDEWVSGADVRDQNTCCYFRPPTALNKYYFVAVCH